MSVEKIKELGKNRSKENFNLLLKLYESDLSVEEKREVVSSIRRQKDEEAIYNFL